MKRTLTVLLTLAMVVALLPLMGTAEAPTIKILGVERQTADSATFAEREKQQVWQAAEKIFEANDVHLDFEIVGTMDQYRTTVQTRLASGHDLPDIAYVGTISGSVNSFV